MDKSSWSFLKESQRLSLSEIENSNLDFTEYQLIKNQGKGPIEATRLVKSKNVGEVVLVRMLRSVYEMNYESAVRLIRMENEN